MDPRPPRMRPGFLACIARALRACWRARRSRATTPKGKICTLVRQEISKGLKVKVLNSEEIANRAGSDPQGGSRCVNHARGICAGAAQQWAFLPRESIPLAFSTYIRRLELSKRSTDGCYNRGRQETSSTCRRRVWSSCGSRASSDEVQRREFRGHIPEPRGNRPAYLVRPTCFM
jgi:hypothetical protein